MFSKVATILSLVLILSTQSVLANGLDPTRPLVGGTNTQSKAVKVNSQLVLQSIITQQNQTKVIVSGKLLAIGDRIGQYQLVNISGNSVTLAGPSEQLTLTIFSGVVAESK